MYRLIDILARRETPNSDDYFSKKDIVREMAVHGMFFKDRTIDYYVGLGIIKKSLRRPGDKRVFWEKNYIINELLAVKTLINEFRLELSEIAELGKATKHHLEDFVISVSKMFDGGQCITTEKSQ